VINWKIANCPGGKCLEINYDGSQGIYAWDAVQRQLVPTGYSPELKDENIARAEKFIYSEHTPAKAIPILEKLLHTQIWESFHIYGDGNTNTPDIHPYTHYLLGLAYELSGDDKNAVRAYWQLWHDYPTQAYTLIARQKLERIR
jgi:hypothetical protein